MIASRRRKATREPTIALINIVFLILIFFMVAGTLAPMPDHEVDFVSSSELECCAQSDVLVVAANGALSYRGEVYDFEQQFLAENRLGDETLRILPDRELPASYLLQTMQRLQAAGAKRILLVTENRQ